MYIISGLTIGQPCHLVALVVTIFLSLKYEVAMTKPTHIDQRSDANQEISSGSNYKHITSSALHLQKLSTTSNNITCNDGSQVGYYKRLNSRSKSWIIYLQGGGFCGSEESCQQRWLLNPQLMSSNFWPKTKSVMGILSNEPRDNPHLWNANHIYVPYCSSDSWSGLAPMKSSASQFSFMGSKILERVLDSLFDDLPRDQSLYEANQVLLAGDSAGATGVILNLDKVREIIEKRAIGNSVSSCTGNQVGLGLNCSGGVQNRPLPVVRGLADSGWFLDNEPYESPGSPVATTMLAGTDPEASGADCDRSRCTPSQSIKQAMTMWNGQLPIACLSQYRAEPWRCYFGYRAYQTLKTPLFVVQWLYDEAQLLVDNIARPDTSGQWSYINKVVSEMRVALQNVTALFAPSCFSHSLITRRTWNQININGFKLPNVLNNWQQLDMQSTSVTNTAISRRKMSSKNDESSLSVATSNIEHNLTTRQAVNTIATTNQTREFIGSQFTQDAVLLDQEPPVVTSSSAASYIRDQDRSLADQQRLAQSKSSSSGGSRPRTRKRKRNNQQQRSKQTRQKSNANNPDSYPSVVVTESTNPMHRDPSNDLASPANNVNQESAPVDRLVQDNSYNRVTKNTASSPLNYARNGRSTFMDDSTTMLSNYVPDDNSSIQPSLTGTESTGSWKPGSNIRTQTSISTDSDNGYLNRYQSTDRFRFIDSCGWPQCNRDCPFVDSDLFV